MWHVACISGGRDSSAMLLGLLERGYPLDEAIFYNTGMEFKSVYENIEKMKKILEENDILYTELHPENNFLFDMLIRPVRYKAPVDPEKPYHYGYEWCGGCVRWGTTSKVRETQRYYRKKFGGGWKQNVIEYIGIAANEPQRVTDNPQKSYPLVEWGMTESDCLQYCYEHGINWNEDGVELYEILDRVSCYVCRNKNLKELKNIYVYLPQYWQVLRGLQTRIDEPFKGEGKSIFDLEERFKQELQNEQELGDALNGS